jgi:alcohol dehydrogenase
MFGSFAEFVALPRAERNLCHLPEKVSFTMAAALGCRTTTAFRAVVQQGRLTEGDVLAVFGCGGVGLSGAPQQQTSTSKQVPAKLLPRNKSLLATNVT